MINEQHLIGQTILSYLLLVEEFGFCYTLGRMFEKLQYKSIDSYYVKKYTMYRNIYYIRNVFENKLQYNWKILSLPSLPLLVNSSKYNYLRIIPIHLLFPW